VRVSMKRIPHYLHLLKKNIYLELFPPEVENQVFIDRGVVSIMDMHLRLSEIKDLGQLSRYGNGFIK
jgi:hypothetical protein